MDNTSVCTRNRPLDMDSQAGESRGVASVTQRRTLAGVIILGVLLILLDLLLLHTGVLYIIGIVLAIIGVVLLLVPIGGRTRRWY
jgi:hypothetical protein